MNIITKEDKDMKKSVVLLLGLAMAASLLAAVPNRRRPRKTRRPQIPQLPARLRTAGPKQRRRPAGRRPAED